jgi:hypothetical protein
MEDKKDSKSISRVEMIIKINKQSCDPLHFIKEKNMILKYLIILIFMYFSLKLKSKVFSVEKDINSYTIKYFRFFFFCVENVSIRVHAKEINVFFKKLVRLTF